MLPSDQAQIAFHLILYAGRARSAAMEAIRSARESDLSFAEEKMMAAEADLRKAHEVQTELLQQEASGKKQPPTMLLVHAQDHLMTALTVKELAQEMIELYRRLQRWERKSE